MNPSASGRQLLMSLAESLRVAPLQNEATANKLYSEDAMGGWKKEGGGKPHE